MTPRDRLHQQIDQLDAHQLAAIDILLTQLTRPQKSRPAASAVSVPPYMRAQHLMAGHRGLAQDIINSRADRVRDSFSTPRRAQDNPGRAVSSEAFTR